MVISSYNVHGCMNCGCIYHDKSLRHKQNCPVCGKGLSFAQDVEGIHY